MNEKWKCGICNEALFNCKRWNFKNAHINRSTGKFTENDDTDLEW